MLLKLIGSIILLQLYSQTLVYLTKNELFNVIDDILMFFLALLLIFKILKKGSITRSTILFPLGIFILICVFSALINSVSVDVFLLQMRSYLLPVVLYFAIANGDYSKKEIINFLKFLIIISLPIFLSAFVEFFLQENLIVKLDRYGDILAPHDIFRTYTLIGNPIDYSNFTVMILCLLIPSVIGKTSLFQVSKLKLLLLIGLIFLTLMMSKSRGPIIAIFISVLFYTYYFKRTSKLKATAFFAAIGISIFFFANSVLDRFARLSPKDLSADEYRYLFMIKSYEIFKDNPLFGVGPGQFGGWVSINYRESPIYSQYNFDTDKISSIDMFFPHLIGELGIAGFLSYLLIYLAPFLFFLKQDSLKMQGHGSYVCSIMILLIPVLLIIGWFSISLETQLVLTLYFIILGMVELYIKQEKYEDYPSLSDQSI